MCGLTGWVSFGSDLTNQTGLVDAMTQTLACRGPDDSGVWIRPKVALGHRRLAVIDVTHGTQPMVVQTERGPVAIVYSGEVYNFAELREELGRHGHEFTTACDTEVVLRGYLQWGDDVAAHLNGMFAFAIWDDRADRLLLVRDRLGIKPLYYAELRDGVVFGSEPKAILAHPEVRPVVDTDGLRELIAYTSRPGWSLWQGIHELEPGSLVIVDAAGLQHRHYWRLRTTPHEGSVTDAVDTVRQLMADIVQRQLVSDVPLCVLLSGGLDSSAIAGVAAAHLAGRGERLRTFSVDFPGYEADFVPDGFRLTPDEPYAREMAQMVKADHRTVLLDPAQLAATEVRRAVIRARDLPPGLDDLDFSKYLLFKAIKEESTVALSGEAADEVFGGYWWTSDEETRKADTFPWLAARRSRPNHRVEALTSDLRRTLNVESYIAEQYKDAMSEVEHLPGESRSEAWMRSVCHLLVTRFLRGQLERKDRVSMSVGLEVRVPFCDHRLVELVYNTPWAWKTFDGREKSLLRGAMAHLVPTSILERVKSPYPSTQSSAYAAQLQREARAVVAERNHPVFDLVDRNWLARAASADIGAVDRDVRLTMNLMLDFYHWLDIYQPDLSVS